MVPSLNLDWYDYGARFYDPALGRCHVPDPLAEIRLNFNPYHYCQNNPVGRIDPNGNGNGDEDEEDDPSKKKEKKDASNDGAHYLEGSFSFDKTFVHYMSNVGLFGSWSNVRGSANVYQGKGGKYFAKVSATGYTPANLKGTTTYSEGIGADVLYPTQGH